MALTRLSLLKSMRLFFVGFICLVIAQATLGHPIAQMSGVRQASFFPSDIESVLESSNVRIDELTLNPPHTVTITGFYRNDTLEVSADLVVQEESLLLDITRLMLNGVDRTLTSTRVDLEGAFASGLDGLIEGTVESYEIEGNSIIVTYAASVPTPTQLPLAVVPSLSAENAAILDRSVNNTTNANSLAFNVDSEITVEREDGDIIFDIQGEGSISQISDPQAVQVDLTFEVTAQQGEEWLTIIIQQRIIDGMLYARGIVPEQAVCTRWITTPFSTLFSTVVVLLSEPNPFTGFGGGLLVPVDSEGNVADLGPLHDLFDLLDFGQFASTSRIDVEGSSARFRTEIDVLGFLDSSELVSLIMLLVRLGGIDVDRSQAEVTAQAFQAFRPVLIPELDLSIYRSVDPQRELLNEIRVDGEISINIPTLEGALSFQQTHIELGLNAQFSQIGETFTVDVPEDQVIVSSLDELQTIPQEELTTEECAL